MRTHIVCLYHEKGGNRMTAKELARMTTWLINFGLTPEQVDELLDFIAYGNTPKEKPKQENKDN